MSTGTDGRLGGAAAVGLAAVAGAAAGFLLAKLMQAPPASQADDELDSLELMCESAHLVCAVWWL